ncbi:MAG: type VI secretion system baseplate subunit TssK, partial [Nitrospinota bacterium]
LSDEMAGFGSSDVTNLWFLFIYNSSLPELKHLYDSPKSHPERLYLVLSRLLGELSTFSANLLPTDVPQYRHEDLRTTFKEIEEKLGVLTEVVSSSRFVPIPLKSAGQNLFTGEIKDERLLDRSKIYLAVTGDFPADEIIDKIPKMTKICSKDTIDLIISANMPGLSLTHTPRPPSSIAVKMGFQYFLIENYGKYWDGIRETRSLAISLPYDLSGARIELVAERE